MMMPVLLQSDRLPLFYQAVREQFNKGGTLGSVLIVLASLAGLVLLVYCLNRLEHKSTKNTEPSDAQRLFRDVLAKLGLNEAQRQLLEGVAKELRLKNPTLLLLSERLFDQHVREWAGRQKGRAAERDKVVSRMRSRLFPGEAGFVSSADWVR